MVGNDNKQMLIEDSIGRRILDAAIEIINKEGYDNLTIRRVAKESGCSNSAIYMRFEDKDALAQAVAALHAKPFLLIMDEGYQAADNLLMNMRRIAYKMLEKVYAMDLESVRMQMVYRGSMMPSENPFVLKWEGYIREAAMKGEVKAGNFRNVAYVIETAFWGFAYMTRSNKHLDKDYALQMWDFQSELIYESMHPKMAEVTLWDKLKEKGVDVDKALERMKGNKEAYKSFLIEFFEDPDFESLKESIETQNARDAFEYAHGLKGMAANLGMENVYEAISMLVEILRQGSLDGTIEAYHKVEVTCEEIRMLLV